MTAKTNGNDKQTEFELLIETDSANDPVAFIEVPLLSLFIYFWYCNFYSLYCLFIGRNNFWSNDYWKIYFPSYFLAVFHNFQHLIFYTHPFPTNYLFIYLFIYDFYFFDIRCCFDRNSRLLFNFLIRFWLLGAINFTAPTDATRGTTVNVITQIGSMASGTIVLSGVSTYKPAATNLRGNTVRTPTQFGKYFLWFSAAFLFHN